MTVLPVCRLGTRWRNRESAAATSSCSTSTSPLPQDDQLYAVATPEGLVVNRLRQIDGRWHMLDDTAGRSARPMHPQDRVVGRLVWCESPGDFNES